MSAARTIGMEGNMAKRLKVALVGAGHMGKFHAQAIAERDDVDFVAVCDVDAGRAAEVAKAHGVRAETDGRRLAGEVDAAVVAASTSAHYEIVLPLVERGAAVLVEKPVAGTAAEARQIAEAVRRAGVVGQAGHILRFDPVTRAVAGRMAKPAYIDVAWASPFSFRSMDVGVVMDVMIHGLDVVLFLAGESPRQVDAVGGVVIGPHEDFVDVRLTFPGGCVANLMASRMSRSKQRLVRVFAEGTYLRMDYADRTVEVITPKPGVAEAIRMGRPPAGGAGGMEDLIAVEAVKVETKPDALRAQLASFLEAVRGERPPAVTMEEGVRAVEVAEEIIRQVQGGRRTG